MTALRAWQNFWRTTQTILVTASRLYFADTITQRLAVTRAQNVFHTITTAGHARTSGIHLMKLVVGDSWKVPTADSETALNGKQAHIVMALSLQQAIRSGHRCLLLTMA